jgi:hypothetical protein
MPDAGSAAFSKFVQCTSPLMALRVISLRRFWIKADIGPDFMRTRPNTTLADLFKLHFRADPFSAVRASERW